MKQEYIKAITELLEKCEDMGLIDLIYKIMQRRVKQ